MRNRAVRGCVILLPLLVSAATLAKSNEPSPSPSEIRKPEQTKPGEPEGPAQNNQDRTAIPPLIIKEVPAPKAQKEPAENTKEADSKTSTDWWMVWLTGILAFVASLQLIVFGLQARRLKQTIEAMKKIGADQSRDMQGWIAVAATSAEAATKAADAAMESVAIAEKTLSVTQRPWINVHVDIGGPLVYDINGANFTFNFILENIGNSPARNVWPEFKIVLLNSGGIITEFDVREIQIEMIEYRKKIEKSYFGHTMLPKEKIHQQITYTIKAADLPGIIQQGAIISPSISPMLVGATYYYSDFSPKPHQTGLIRGIIRNDVPQAESITKGRFQLPIFIDEGDTPAGDLRIFRPLLESGGYAD
jgi:hypothetical protein